MVIVIFGILSATALPRFIDLSAKAKDSSARAMLGSIREAIAFQYASNARMPAQLTADMFSNSQVPLEPLTNSNLVSLGNNPSGATGGWLYDSENGRVWINHSNYSTY